MLNESSFFHYCNIFLSWAPKIPGNTDMFFCLPVKEQRYLDREIFFSFQRSENLDCAMEKEVQSYKTAQTIRVFPRHHKLGVVIISHSHTKST